MSDEEAGFVAEASTTLNASSDADFSAALDFSAVAQRLVNMVVTTTDFTVATITVREGDRCRRLATAGLADGRIGMTTSYEHWAELLKDEWRCGAVSYLIPPEAPARWADTPQIEPIDAPDAWTAEHGLILPLRDHRDEVIGFIGVDQPRSGLLPDAPTVERLEAFAREAQARFLNAHLYAKARRQADTMTQLFEVAKTMATTSDLDEVIPGILQAMANRYDAREVMVGRVAGRDLQMWISERAVAGGVESRGVLLDEPLLGLVEQLRRDGLILINDLAEHGELAGRLTAGTGALLAAGAAGDDDGNMVVLAVTSSGNAAFDTQDGAFLAGLLDITLVAMRNARLYEEARSAADRDPLTGLRNRRLFWPTVQHMLGDASEEHPVALAVVDIDDFKRLNDTFGHDVGDRALRHVAMRLEAGVRETDAVFRIGGEEFVLVMPGSDLDGAVIALDRIRASIGRSRLDIPDVSASAGVAVASASSVTGDELFAAADAALFRAKRAGKNRVATAPEMQQQGG